MGGQEQRHQCLDAVTRMSFIMHSKSKGDLIVHLWCEHQATKSQSKQGMRGAKKRQPDLFPDIVQQCMHLS